MPSLIAERPRLALGVAAALAGAPALRPGIRHRPGGVGRRIVRPAGGARGLGAPGRRVQAAQRRHGAGAWQAARVEGAQAHAQAGLLTGIVGQRRPAAPRRSHHRPSPRLRSLRRRRRRLRAPKPASARAATTNEDGPGRPVLAGRSGSSSRRRGEVRGRNVVPSRVMEVGEHFAGYRLDAVAGTGSTATVYEATQLSTDRRVALKIVSTTAAIESDNARERIRRAPRAARRASSTTTSSRCSKLPSPARGCSSRCCSSAGRRSHSGSTAAS